MLAGAVCGEVFASPSIGAILAAIRQLGREAGALLIVKNYTGDRINFGLAAERAKAEGIDVKMVVVGDDVALPNVRQPRGVAGTLFVHKIAGFAAARGDSLEQVYAIAKRVAMRLSTVGVALDTCTLPDDKLRRSRVPDDQFEFGLGIHGEPG
jgi:dihydroxyacetone kinase